MTCYLLVSNLVKSSTIEHAELVLLVSGEDLIVV